MQKYKSKEEAHKDHINNYRSDGVQKGKGQPYSSDFLRVSYIVNNVPKNSYVLDVGCNGGTIGIPLLHKQCHVKGIDIVQDLVDKAKNRGIFAEQGTAEDLSRFADGTFDIVVCTEVLEHLYDPLEAIKEAHRVLRDGGKYIVTVPHPNSTMAQGLGDYHQQNFSMEILDTLFHLFFKRGDVSFVEIPYAEHYCKANMLNPEIPQWLGLEAIKK